MGVVYSKENDFDGWIFLAREVEPLFGPMADEIDFQEALRKAISLKTAFCIYSEINGNNKLIGGVVISKETNEIAWLAVMNKFRGKGYGRKLIEFAISKLNQQKNIFVQTFDGTVSAGKTARNLYFDFGFTDLKDGGLNPAGVPTVIMQLEPLKVNCAQQGH
jgi:GNAT superfamily N-acetyltransferase